MGKLSIADLLAAGGSSRQRQTHGRFGVSAADVRVEYRQGKLELYTPYDPGLVDELKSAIPYTHRIWNRTRKCWEVTPEYAEQLHQVVSRTLGVDLHLPPNLPGQTLVVATEVLNVRYIGRVKLREDGSECAFGWMDEGWNAVFPKVELMRWFGHDVLASPDGTHYSVLGIAPDALAAQVKGAYRRMARQWHPDVCAEPDANERFLQVQEAYEVLSDQRRRMKYDAGLRLESSLKHNKDRRNSEWHSPLRCGMILANGVPRLGRFVVHSILSWQDIVNEHGETLVSSWPSGAKHFKEEWSK